MGSQSLSFLHSLSFSLCLSFFLSKLIRLSYYSSFSVISLKSTLDVPLYLSLCFCICQTKHSLFLTFLFVSQPSLFSIQCCFHSIHNTFESLCLYICLFVHLYLPHFGLSLCLFCFFLSPQLLAEGSSEEMWVPCFATTFRQKFLRRSFPGIE